MIKDIIDKNTETKPYSKKLEVLREHFAGCFTAEGAFDIEHFKGMMKDEIDTTTVIEPDLGASLYGALWL